MNNETLTKCICHKGFSGYSSVVARSNIRIGGQETTPQSLTAHTLDRQTVQKLPLIVKNHSFKSLSAGHLCCNLVVRLIQSGYAA